MSNSPRTGPRTGVTVRDPQAAVPGTWRIVAPFGVSFLGDGLSTVALPLLAFQASRAPFAVGLVAFCRSVPWAFFAPFAGVLADYWDRRRMLVTASALRCLLLLAVAAALAAGGLGLGALVVVAVLLGVCEVGYDTAAQTVLPSLVPADRLGSANARLSAVETLSSHLAGPALAGLLAALTLGRLTVGTAAVYAVALLLLSRLRSPRTSPPENPRVLAGIREGFGFLWSHRPLRTLTWSTALGATAYTGWFAQFTLYAVSPGPMGLSSRAFGVVLAVSAVGSLGAALIVPRLQRAVPTRFVLVLSSVLVVVGLLLPVAGRAPAFATAGLSVYGAAVVLWNVASVTYRQQEVPAHLLGRVTAAYRTVAWGAAPLGALAGGALGQFLGLNTCLIALAALPLLQLPALFRFPRLAAR
ncbi:MFS transporter [Streptomyces sp. NPDC049099]|uniref:MFS transporter n=1 Tax=Streptomyces sp. NPDC049099 TaxID=3155768 RepID=UPI003423CAC7